MKKFLIQSKDSRNHPRRRTDEERDISKHGSSEREQYSADEHLSMEYHKHAYQMERRSKTDFQDFVKPKETHSIQNYNHNQARYSRIPTNICPDVNKSDKDTEHSDSQENYNKFHNAPSLNQNKGNSYLHSNRIFKDAISKTAIKIRREFSPIYNTEDENFDEPKNSNKLSINEENHSMYPDVQKSHFEKKSSLPLRETHSIPVHESNQSYEEENYQTNPYPHAISTHKEKINSQGYNSTQKTFLPYQSAPYQEVGFFKLKLKDLLYYNANLMQNGLLFEYASALKCKILEIIDKFQPPEKNELKVLCEITDGDQSEKNQQIITTRTCDIVKNITEKFPLLLSSQEVLHTSQIVNQTAPHFHTMTNGYCSNNTSPVLEIVSDSNTVTSTTDYNLMPEYNVSQNHKHVVSKEISDVFVVESSNHHKRNYESQNCNTIKNRPVNQSLITGTQDSKRQTLSEHCYSSYEDSREHVPEKNFSFDERNSFFITFKLENLLTYDVYSMHGDSVFDYAFSLKERILENINKFRDPYKEKLQFLCELTDGTQREENQLLINERMCLLIDSAYEKGYVF